MKIAANEELSDKDILLMASLGPKEASDDKSVVSGDSSSIDNSTTNEGAPMVANSTTTGNEKNHLQYLNNSEIHEVSTSLTSKMSTENNDEKLLQRCKGGPVYYKGYDGGPYVIGFLDKNYAVQPIEKEAFQFLVKCVNEGKKMRKKVHKNIEEDKITKLDLARNEFGPLDIKYLTG